MKKITIMALFMGLAIMITACTGGGGVYRHHHGNGPWWGSRGYYRDRIIVVPDKEPDVEATPLPSEPEQMPMPDMGAPDFGGDIGGDFGGDW